MARRTPAPDADHRAAYMAGRSGRPMPPGVAARATGEASLDAMHDAGRQGTDYEAALKEHAPTVHEKAFNPAPPPAPPGPAPSTPPRAPRSGGGRPRTLRSLVRSGSPTETGAGVVLGLVGYALILSVVRYGSKGPVLWIKAKFLNETTGAPKTTATTSSGKTLA